MSPLTAMRVVISIGGVVAALVAANIIAGVKTLIRLERARL